MILHDIKAPEHGVVLAVVGDYFRNSRFAERGCQQRVEEPFSAQSMLPQPREETRHGLTFREHSHDFAGIPPDFRAGSRIAHAQGIRHATGVTDDVNEFRQGLRSNRKPWPSSSRPWRSVSAGA